MRRIGTFLRPSFTVEETRKIRDDTGDEASLVNNFQDMSDQISSFREALTSNPADWEARFGLIYALHQEGRTSEAVNLLSEVAALPSNDRDIIFAAQSYHVLGATEQAQSVYETALQMNPANQAAKAGLESLGVAVAAPPPIQPVPLVDPETAEVEVASPAKALVVEDDDGDDSVVAKPVQPLAETTLKPAVETGAGTIPLEEAASVAIAGHSMAEGVTPPPVITKDDTIPYDPDTAMLADHIHEAEEESKRKYEASINRDRINSVMVTILVHVAIVLALMFTLTKIPRRVPPQIVASSTAETNDPAIEKQVMKKTSLKAAPTSDSSAADILTVPSVSAISMASMDMSGADIPVETGMTFQPSMSLGMPSSAKSMMMFGQPLEGEVLGVVLDVSGSMAEWLPLVIREVDRNFKDAPIVYINNALIRQNKHELEIRPIVSEEVKPRREDGTSTPFWFLWGDLPRKAPQRSVDRLIKTFRERPNQFIVVGKNGHWRTGDRLGAAMKFLAEENCDAIYVFSDFEDFIDEDLALEHGRALARRKVRAYIQPAVEESEFIKIMAQRVANRTKGRQLPTLSSIITPEDDTPAPLIPPRPTTVKPPDGVTYAKPRESQIGGEFYHFKPNKGWHEITRLEEPEFDAVFYGPAARAAIFLKNNDGAYIQNPIQFTYHSAKYLPDHPDHAFRWRGRKFLRTEEPPSFDGKEIRWKMILEDELKFEVRLYLDRKGMNATYIAEPPNDGTSDHAHITFHFPGLARESKDMYYGQDLPAGGLNLDDVRAFATPNQVVINLPRQDRDRFGKTWAQLGFEPGYNTRTFETLITRMPSGIRDLKISGPSFGERVIHARTTASKILLGGGWNRQDFEPWEGFRSTLVRPADRRTRFTKTEAIALRIE